MHKLERKRVHAKPHLNDAEDPILARDQSMVDIEAVEASKINLGHFGPS